MTDPAERVATAQPFPQAMGVEVLSAEPARVTARMVVRPDLCTTGNILHGGAIMAFADMMGVPAHSSICRTARAPRPSKARRISSLR